MIGYVLCGVMALLTFLSMAGSGFDAGIKRHN